MKLYIKEEIFTLGDTFSIYDELGNEKYYAQSEVISFGRKLHLYDTSENELAFIRQRLMTFLPKYMVEINGEEVAEVIKEFTLFRQAYSVPALDWHIEGDFFSHEFTVCKGEEQIATVSREWFTLGDAYAIEISPSAHEIMALAVVLIIDMIAEDSN